MPRQAKGGSVDMTELVNYIRSYIKQQQRDNPRFTQTALARKSKLSGSTLSELMRHADREPSGLTLAKLADGMEMERRDLYRIAYPRGRAVHYNPLRDHKDIEQRAVLIIRNDPDYYDMLLNRLERLTPERRARVLAYAEGVQEAKTGLEPS